MQRSFYFPAFLLILCHLAFSQDYIWPTDASQLFTSSFAESRGGRFHAGVDIRTWGRTGYPIFAIRDGFVSRIRVSPFGYGRALYVTLDTGEIVVYGHLEKFRDDIAAYVKTEQTRRNNYDIQLFPTKSRFQVKQGDLIAYSGDSGVGYPHLHFEMRDAASNPINPLLKGYTVVDNIAPVITKLLIQPLDALSSVDGDFMPKLFWPGALGDGTYRVNNAIIVSGRIGFGVGSFDQMDGVDNKFGTYRNELYIDDELVFAAQYDKFSYAINNHFNLDRDYRQRAYGNGYIYNLFRDYGNNLWFYSSRQLFAGVVDFINSATIDSNRVKPDEIVDIPQGVIKLDGGSHTFKIIVQDYWGNASKVTGQLIVDGEELLASFQGTPAEELYGPDPPNSEMLPELDDEDTTKDINLRIRFYDRFLRIRLSPRVPLLDRPVVSGWLCSGKTYQMPLTTRAGSYIGAWPLFGCTQGPLPISIRYVTQAGDTLIQNEWIEFTTVPRGQIKSVYSDDGLCKLEFATNSLFKDIFVRTRATAPGSNSYDVVGNYYRIYPFDVPLNKGAKISLVYPENDSLPDKLGIYFKAGDRMRFVGNRRDASERRISAHVTYFGTFTLVRDVEPPRLLSLSPINGSRTQQTKPLLRAVFKDELSGIAGESNRLLKLDGKKVIAEYDPEALALVYTPDEPLSRGEHTMELFLKDRSGNVTRRVNTFYID
jgi:hypothetical protein